MTTQGILQQKRKRATSIVQPIFQPRLPYYASGKRLFAEDLPPAPSDAERRMLIAAETDAIVQKRLLPGSGLPQIVFLGLGDRKRRESRVLDVLCARASVWFHICDFGTERYKVQRTVEQIEADLAARGAVLRELDQRDYDKNTANYRTMTHNVITFIARHLDEIRNVNEESLIVVSCMAGRSRSVIGASAVALLCGTSDRDTVQKFLENKEMGSVWEQLVVSSA